MTQNIVYMVGGSVHQIGNKPERHISLPALVKDKRQQTVKCKSIVDTGNTLNGSCVISAQFHRKLGVEFPKMNKGGLGRQRKPPS